MSARRWLAAGLTLPILALAPAGHHAPARNRYVCDFRFHSLVLTRTEEHGMHVEKATGHVTESCKAELATEAVVLRLQLFNPRTLKWFAAGPAVRWGPHPGIHNAVITGHCYRNTRERMTLFAVGVTKQGMPGKYRKKWPFHGIGMRTVNCQRRYPAER